MLLYEEESYKIRGAVYKIYQKFRNYHKELVYHNALCNDLVDLKFKVEKNKKIFIYHQGRQVGVYVPDLVVNNQIVIELKSKPKLTMEDIKQFWHYLKSSGYQVGFLINFGDPDGVQIERKVFTKSSALVPLSSA